MQENIVGRYPDADLAVYAVWVPALPTDQRFEVADLLVDHRARHFWDGKHVVGEGLRRTLGIPEGQIVWDVFLAFGPDARWDGEPPTPLAVGAPVIDVTGRLEAALKPYLEP